MKISPLGRPFELLSRFAVVAVMVCAGAFVSPAQGGPTADEAKLEADNPVKALPEIPKGLLVTWDQLKENKPDPKRVRLGRWLFFDKRLSADNTVSCASCHRPTHAFTEPTPVSTGIKGQKGGRKAPTFLNAAWAFSAHTFWDGRAASLEEQAKGPITNPIEMGMPDHDVVVAKLAKQTGYKRYFTEAFGDDNITIDRIAKAIADYERTRLSGNSPWDRWRAAMTDHDRAVIETLTADTSFGEVDGPKEFKDGKHVSAKVKLGHVLFHNRAGCAQCHVGSNFTDAKFHNLGVGYVPDSKTFKDEGRFAVTGKAEDRGAFKTPTVREAAKRAPFMHDGSEKTLRDVVVFYNVGGQKNPHLSPKMKPLKLNKDEIDALVAFMEALSGEGYADESPKFFP